MATLNSLKQALRQKAEATAPSQKHRLSDKEYSTGFDILKGSEWMTYQKFIIPQLSQLLTPLINTRIDVSVLEIGPGPNSVFGHLPSHLRQKIKRYTAFEPNVFFATTLEESLCSPSETGLPLPCMKSPPQIYRTPFVLQDSTGARDDSEKYDIIVFCHSMYGMKPKRSFIEQAMGMLVDQPQGSLVVVFHREAPHFDGLVCHQTASFPTGAVSVANEDETLDRFARFVTGYSMQDMDAGEAMRDEWREVCRSLGHCEEAHSNRLSFSSPNIMVAFTQNGTMLPDLIAQVPLVEGHRSVKNREACTHRPASIVNPTDIHHVQQCVRWALKHQVGLAVLGGSHSGHCVLPNVITIDMAAFNQMQVITGVENEIESGSSSGSFVVAGTGCKTGEIISKAMSAGLTVPLGARPSVGAGLWLQGGIGHLARLHGLACDAIVGAVVVSVKTGQVLCIGRVPSQCWLVDAVRPENENELLWATKGAGSNFGIVISITFKAYTAPTYAIRNWVVPLSNNPEAMLKLSDFNKITRDLPRNLSADAYLYWDKDQLHLGVTMFDSSGSKLTSEKPTPTPMSKILGSDGNSKVVDCIGLFDTEMYVSGMHGGHAGGKTSSFKRCLFLKDIGVTDVAEILIAAVETRPSPLCYLHLLHGGGAVGDVAANATAFGCRDWDFACVVTGVWPRDQDGTEAARSVLEWVYNVAERLLPLSSGVYGADLGPDPRDAALAAMAFGLNKPHLAHLKRNLDPSNVLAYACPIPKAPLKQKLIILVTGKTGAGKDYCADIWVSVITTHAHKSVTVRSVSISDATKREYAVANGANLDLLLHNRAYKEKHRAKLTKFFEDQEQQRPRLREESFENTVHHAADVDVLLITGMRDDAPVAAFWHLVPDRRLLEVRVEADEEKRQVHRGFRSGDNSSDKNKDSKDSNNSKSSLTALGYSPHFNFDNTTDGHGAAELFAKRHLLPFVDNPNLQRLARMVHQVKDFPHAGIDFRHVLGISQQPGGLALCTSLLQSHFTADWAKVNAIVCCEAGGFVYASALALRVDVHLVLIREAGKLPSPTISVSKPSSNISSLASEDSQGKRIVMERDVVSRGDSVVVVDDVLSSGETLCAVLRLLKNAGIKAEDTSVMVVAELPAQRGRELLRKQGFARVNIQSLLVFGGA